MAVRHAPEGQGVSAVAVYPASRDTTRAIVTTTVGLALLAGMIHGAVVPEHMMEAAEGNLAGWLPVAFAAAFGAGLVWALGLAVLGASRPWLWLGLGVHTVMAAAGIISRTVGLPGMEVEGPSPAFLTAVAAELAVAGLCAWLLARRQPAGSDLPRPLTVGLAVVAAAGLALILVGSGFFEHASMLGKWMWLPSKWMWLPFSVRWG